MDWMFEMYGGCIGALLVNTTALMWPKRSEFNSQSFQLNALSSQQAAFALLATDDAIKW